MKGKTKINKKIQHKNAWYKTTTQ